MDSNQQTTLAQKNDPALTARLVAAVADVERDHRLVEGPISQRLLDEIEATMRKAAPDPWVVGQARYAALLAHPEWKPTKGLGNGDLWFEVSEIADDDADALTWIGAACGTGQSKFGLEVCLRPALTQAADVVWREKAHNDKLAKIGIVRETATGRLLVPIKIDRMRLSKGFSENDLTDALSPVTKAVEAVVAAKAELDTLLNAVRAKVKR